MSLRDQLLKAGLADKKKVAKANRQLKKRRRKEQAEQDSKAERRRAAEAERAAAEAARLEKIRVERARRLAIQEAQRRARAVRKMVRSYALPERSGQTSFWHRAPDGRTLLRLRLPESWAHDLQQGRLAVAWSGPTAALADICVLPDYAARRVLAEEPRRILFFNEAPPDPEDPSERLYGAFGEASAPEIPDGTPTRHPRGPLLRLG